MSLDRKTPRGYRKAWSGGVLPPRAPFGSLLFKAVAVLRDGEQLVVEPDESGALIARRELRIVGIAEQPGDMLTQVKARFSIAAGVVLPPGDEPAGYATLQLS